VSRARREGRKGAPEGARHVAQYVARPGSQGREGALENQRALRVHVAHTAGEFHFEVNLQLGAGLTALIGPSGSGKTTLLNIVAGIVRPDRGIVELNGRVLTDSAARIFVPPHRRRIGYVFQEPRLFPHLTVRQNLLYGRWFRKHVPGGMELDEIIELLSLGPLLARRPTRLSGGEKQRVALGRVLLSRPELLLLDEPLASVDQIHRAEILPYLDRVRADHALPAIYVTHTWAEVAGRADQVVALREGRLEFSGSVAEFDARSSVRA
jgi:molybdate transport system ATP-binding protein